MLTPLLGLLALPLAAQGAAAPGLGVVFGVFADPTFGGDGKVVTDFGGSDSASGVAIQADGKIVAAGFGGLGVFALARYSPDGSLDPSFDGDGRVLTDFGGAGGEGARAVGIQTDGKIVAAGFSGGDFALARYNPDGSLDPSFDGDGRVVTGFGPLDHAAGVVIQADGKIVAAGGSGPDFALARYNADGSLDATFGGGLVLTDFGANDNALGVAMQPDGKVVAVGFSGEAGGLSNFALARYNPDGSLDASFDGDGRVVTDFFGAGDFAADVAIQADGKIVAAGGSGGDFALARYNPDGSLDASFDGDGRVVSRFFGSPLDRASGVAVQADGKIVAAGISEGAGANPPNFALARYNPDGSLDATYGDGRVVTDFGAFDAAMDVAIQADGKIVAAGGSGGDFALARYVPGPVNLPQPVSFSSPTNFAAGSLPVSVAIGDFNGNSDPDLAVANQASDDVSILLGSGDGTFTGPTNFAAGSFPTSVAVGDFNGDSRPDLAVTTSAELGGTAGVSILLGNGDGTFAGPTNFAAGQGFFSVAVGDFNGDSDPDLAVTSGTNVSILLGNGDGTFTGPTDVAAGTGFGPLAVGDFNGDSDPDLAVADLFSNTVSILLGNGDGTFAAPTNFLVATGSVAIGDFDNDSDLDLAVANERILGKVSILLGNGDGTFTRSTDLAVGLEPRSVAVGDFNGDANPDLSAANFFSDDVSILLGNGDGTFTGPTNFAVGSVPGSVAVADFNADSAPDLAVANKVNNVSILLNTTVVNRPPTCSAVTAVPSVLSPPNHKFVPVTLRGATDPDGDPVALTITGVTQDELVNGNGDGNTSPDARRASAGNKVFPRAERSGQGNGRAYRIAFTASDGKGGNCEGAATVAVPHSKKRPAVDSAPPSYNSFGP